MVTPIKSTLRLTSKLTPSPLSLLSPKFQSPLNLLKKPIKNLNVNRSIFNDHKPNFVQNLRTLHFNFDSIQQSNRCDIIGRGSFGVVIRGDYKDKPVAIKVAKLERRYYQNDYNSLGFDHRNVIKTHDIVTINDYNLVIMEYIDNVHDLYSILMNCNDTNRQLEKSDRLKYAIDIVEGLDYCHKMKILHLDLKPKNILLCNGICKICDFGNSISLNQISTFNISKGTVAYTAPELFTGRTPSTKSDIYSLGIVLWQLETRQLPYENFDNETIIYNVVKFDLRPDRDQSNKTESFGLYRDCWQKSPCDRPETTPILAKLKTLKN